MPRILHLADLHLGWFPEYLGAKAAARAEERDAVLQRAVELALKPDSDIRMVVIAGDLFETHRPDGHLVSRTISLLRRLESAGIRTVTVPGNHDEITYRDSVYRLTGGSWPGILVRNPSPQHVATVEVGGAALHIYSLAYTGGITKTSPPISEFPRTSDPGYHIAVFHGSLGWAAGDRSLPLDPESLSRSGYHYVALGHIHQHSVRPLERGKAVYAGMVEAKGFSDPGVGFFTVVTLPETPAPGAPAQPASSWDMGVRVETVDADSRPVRVAELDVSSCGSMSEAVGAVLSLGDSEAIQRVVLRGMVSFDLDAGAIARSAGEAFWYLEVVDNTEGLSNALIESISMENTVRGCFVRRMRSAMESDPGRAGVYMAALRRGLAAMKGGGTP